MSGTDWDYVECGFDHTLAVTTTGDLYSTGYNSNGQLGLNDLNNRNLFTFISSGWLYNSYNGLAQFGGGGNHSHAITNSNILKSTGNNADGELGMGNEGVGTDLNQFAAVTDSIPVDGSSDTWEYIVHGANHTMALKIVGNIVTNTTTAINEPQVWKMPGEK